MNIVKKVYKMTYREIKRMKDNLYYEIEAMNKIKNPIYTKFKNCVILKKEKEKKKNQYNFLCYMLENFDKVKD